MLVVATASSIAAEKSVFVATQRDAPCESRVTWTWEEVIDEQEVATEDDLLNQADDELLPPPEDDKSPRAPRRIDWKSLFSGSTTTERKEPKASSSMKEVPHPLRTNLWEINIRWKGPAARRRRLKQNQKALLDHSLYSSSKLVLEFDLSGFVRIRAKSDGVTAEEEEEDAANWVATGKWSADTPPLVTFSIPLPSDDNDETVLKHHFEADLHMNPFGKHAKFTRGVVVRDHANLSPWFRPVVATFSGVGVGKDTVDLSYKKRKPPKQL